MPCIWAAMPPSTRPARDARASVAIARAIATDPVLLLADEPTGALDSHSTDDVLALFADLNADGRTIIVITHEEEVAHHAKRVVRMRDGRIVADRRVEAVTVKIVKLAIAEGSEKIGMTLSRERRG